jgi:hypothetical protein
MARTRRPEQAARDRLRHVHTSAATGERRRPHNRGKHARIESVTEAERPQHITEGEASSRPPVVLLPLASALRDVLLGFRHGAGRPARRAVTV